MSFGWLSWIFCKREQHLRLGGGHGRQAHFDIHVALQGVVGHGVDGVDDVGVVVQGVVDQDRAAGFSLASQ
jgi:hypothetical protein